LGVGSTGLLVASFAGAFAGLQMNNVSIISSLTLQEFSDTGQDTDQEQLMHLKKMIFFFWQSSHWNELDLS
jgi:hypothetical protein